jgi:hypothetical protein
MRELIVQSWIRTGITESDLVVDNAKKKADSVFINK